MSVRRRRVTAVAGMWVVGFMNACAPPSGPDASIVVLPRIDSVVLGSTTAFSAQWGDGVGVDAAIHWMTSDSMVATVHANGSAHALELGVARITASVDGLESAPATLVVVPPPESAIGLTPSSARVPVGSIVLFTASSVGAGHWSTGGVLPVDDVGSKGRRGVRGSRISLCHGRRVAPGRDGNQRGQRQHG